MRMLCLSSVIFFRYLALQLTLRCILVSAYSALATMHDMQALQEFAVWIR